MGKFAPENLMDVLGGIAADAWAAEPFAAPTAESLPPGMEAMAQVKDEPHGHCDISDQIEKVKPMPSFIPAVGQKVLWTDGVAKKGSYTVKAAGKGPKGYISAVVTSDTTGQHYEIRFDDKNVPSGEWRFRGRTGQVIWQ